jgi:UV DNA damage endonuclease
VKQNLFPWASEYQLEDLTHFQEISQVLKGIGRYAKEHDVRITCHPGHFNVLCSPNPNVIKNTIVDLELHGKIFDIMGLSQTPYNKINIHCNGTYGDKTSSLLRWCENFSLLSPSVQSRLTIENDDKSSMYSVKDLMTIH